MFAQTFRQRCQKVSARRRHWGQGISPASSVLTSKRDACALSAGGGEGFGPASGGAFSPVEVSILFAVAVDIVSLKAKSGTAPFLTGAEDASFYLVQNNREGAYKTPSLYSLWAYGVLTRHPALPLFDCRSVTF